MTTKAPFQLRTYNPDVLACIANLSNDEVFTPPDLANQMLDTLAKAWAEDHGGASIWENPEVRFLDPCTKSGIFLREITRRLAGGLKDQIPDLQERVDHILTKQVFGIAITELTALLARRSVYCSKHAKGPHSIAKSFATDDGNIWFQRTYHDWHEGRCRACGASRAKLDREEALETYAYPFIHAPDIKAKLAEIFGADMQFDVVIGNPPYQLEDGGYGASATPIYHRFIEAALGVQPKMLLMVVPSRWLFGGRGLESFRQRMFEDGRIRVLVDYHDSRQVFSGVDVAGGICYFLWHYQHTGPCLVVENHPDGKVIRSVRPLQEEGLDTFIRSKFALSIIKKVMSVESPYGSLSLPDYKRFQNQVSSQKPFGFRTYFRGRDKRLAPDDVIVKRSKGLGWVSRDEVPEGKELIDKWKVFTSKSSAEHAGQPDRQGQRRVLSLSGILPPGSVVTETYVLLGVFDSEDEAKNCFSYVQTKFFRFLLAARTSAQDLPRAAYEFIPVQDYSTPWSDPALYNKYNLSQDEIDYIETFIRPMNEEWVLEED